MGRPPVDEKSWIVEYYDKIGDGSERYWTMPREGWLINEPHDFGERVLQRSLEDLIVAFRKRSLSFGPYWNGHTWRFRNLNTGEVIPWEALQ